LQRMWLDDPAASTAPGQVATPTGRP
jgi:hypothetical protein